MASCVPWTRCLRIGGGNDARGSAAHFLSVSRNSRTTPAHRFQSSRVSQPPGRSYPGQLAFGQCQLKNHPLISGFAPQCGHGNMTGRRAIRQTTYGTSRNARMLAQHNKGMMLSPTANASSPSQPASRRPCGGCEHNFSANSTVAAQNGTSAMPFLIFHSRLSRYRSGNMRCFDGRPVAVFFVGSLNCSPPIRCTGSFVAQARHPSRIAGAAA